MSTSDVLAYEPSLFLFLFFCGLRPASSTMDAFGVRTGCRSMARATSRPVALLTAYLRTTSLMSRIASSRISIRVRSRSWARRSTIGSSCTRARTMAGIYLRIRVATVSRLRLLWRPARRGLRTWAGSMCNLLRGRSGMKRPHVRSWSMLVSGTMLVPVLICYHRQFVLG